jgi:hypothetical protein
MYHLIVYIHTEHTPVSTNKSFSAGSFQAHIAPHTQTHTPHTLFTLLYQPPNPPQQAASSHCHTHTNTYTHIRRVVHTDSRINYQILLSRQSPHIARARTYTHSHTPHTSFTLSYHGNYQILLSRQLPHISRLTTPNNNVIIKLTPTHTHKKGQSLRRVPTQGQKFFGYHCLR